MSATADSSCGELSAALQRNAKHCSGALWAPCKGNHRRSQTAATASLRANDTNARFCSFQLAHIHRV